MSITHLIACSFREFAIIKTIKEALVIFFSLSDLSKATASICYELSIYSL